MEQSPPTSARNDSDRYLIRRGGVWHFRRRVPRDLADRDTRGEIRVTTGTRDRATALVISARLNSELEAHWRNLADADGKVPSPDSVAERFEAAAKMARRLGLAYRPAAELAKAPIADLVARIELLEQRGAIKSAPLVSAVLGGADRPAMTLGQMFDAYEKHAADRLLGKSEDQVRKWRNPRLRAIANLVDLIGDKPLADVTRDDALDFRTWWLDRVRDDGYDQGSANKDLGYIATMMETLDMAWRLKLTLPFKGVRIAGEKHNPRIPYDPDFVRTRILPGDALQAMNAEARAVVVMVAATGMRPSEVVGLTEQRINLDVEIPFVEIRPDHRQLKTVHSERDVPLVGRALDVMQQFPQGFPRYRQSPDSLSATINKGLGSAGLRPTPAHTLYSLRHTFKDRLIALEAPQRIQDALMGHAVHEVAYGAGPTLKHRAEWLSRVWG